MNLEKHYNKLYIEVYSKNLLSNEYQIDDLIDAPLDKRFGITLP